MIRVVIRISVLVGALVAFVAFYQLFFAGTAV